ncbi:hypothetical protein [Parabacteroides sp. AM08-6]|uniref:hypothetical protein n=1 Tax=Parabacteroides sp. AM08-6 TaxID=2292053 RepID=UPI0011C3715E|nr:hypothetical protein [Parabacteroides sp. AM08-6]
MRNLQIYEDIYVCQGNQDVIGKSLNLYRKQLDYLSKFEYSPQNDTVYILEMYGAQGNLLITIWNKNKMLSYTNEQGPFESKNESLFTKYMMELVSEWNIPGIRKEEINSNTLPSELIYATKIVFNKGKYHIACIYFKDFFNLERDTGNEIY